MRYADVMDFRIEINPECEGLLLPKLTLQPIVENALYHGLERRRRKGNILIDVKSEEHRVVLSVSDDGLGMTREELAALRTVIASDKEMEGQGSRSFGLQLVARRLRLLFVQEVEILIDSDLGVGTVITLLLPLNKG